MKKRVLLITLTSFYGKDANTIIDHSESFVKYSSFQVDKVNFNWAGRYFCKKFSRYINDYDVVIIHYSVHTFFKEEYNKLVLLLKGFIGTKVLFIQDEYRYVSRINRVIIRLGIDIVYSCAGYDVSQIIYKEALENSDVKVLQTLTGYLPDNISRRRVKKISKRKMDVVYRARKLPLYFGNECLEKYRIGEEFVAHALNTNLKINISGLEEDRLYGKKWLSFLSSSKASLGAQSSIDIIDYDGEIFDVVPQYLEKYPDTTFEEVREKFLSNAEGKILIQVISPRIFEYVCCKTAMVLLEGSYSDILRPWEHYIPLKRDFSNFSEIVRLLNDDDYLQKMVDRAYQDIVYNSSLSYKGFVRGVDRDLGGVLDNSRSRSTRLLQLYFYLHYGYAILLKLIYKVVMRIYMV